MLTPQEVSSKTFPKAVMGGYAMASVDDFLDTLTEDYTNLCKDNAALKAKIKALAEKMEESRKNEESFRALLISAQKMSEEMIMQAESKRDEIVKEAESHRDAIMGDAEAAARKRIEELRAEVKAEEQRLAEKKKEVDDAVAAEEYRLERIRSAVASFVMMAKSTCQEQLELLAQLELAMPPEPEKSAAVAEDVFAAAAAEEESAEAEEDFDSFFPFPAEENADVMAEEAEDEEEEDEEESKFFTAVVPSLASLKGLLKRKDREVEDEEEDEWEEEESEEAEGGAEDLDVQDDIASVMRQFAEEDQATLFTSGPEDETRVINLDDLQFGRNYTAED